MSEIEKMYENAGIKPIAEYCKHQCNNEFDDDACIGCKHIERVEYPPFTAEKQIELFKWLIQKYKTISIEHQLNLFYINIRDIYTGMVHIEFNETIAGLINNLWQDLTEEERKQIADILKG